MNRSIAVWMVCVLLVVLQVGCTVSPGGRGGGEDESAAAARLGDAWFRDVLDGSAAMWGGLLRDPTGHRVQILVSEVIEDPEGPPTLRRYRYRVDAEYVYPASTIKLAGCVAALIELQRLQAESGLALTADTPLVLYPRREDGMVRVRDDSNVDNGTITLRQEIRKTCFVSSNEAYNRLYDFVGRDRLNQILWEAGLESFRLHHRLSDPGDEAYHRFTPQVDMVLDQRAYSVGPRTAVVSLPLAGVRGGLLLGERHVNEAGALVEEPFDFSDKNWVSMEDLQDLVVMVTRPEIELGKPGLGLSGQHRTLMLSAMSQDPLESSNPVYSSSRYAPGSFDSYVVDGIAKVVPRPAVVAFDKSGTAYGYRLDTGYYLDRSTGASFYLTVAVYNNPNGTINDDTYGYEAANRFHETLGERVARKLWRAAERQ
ncbi:serine hydrolase [Mucisphaera sp.]|uniref:serine hydrolase n=1 Tax=Mucisphaera sp. TaxID=2913024 RepID=UPI003D0E7245